MEKIRNFCIIAHIDHGKSTLADRMLELTGTVDVRQMEAQVLDDMDLEKERGITIKSHAIQMDYKGYTLNLIDTPGHVDFSYEVSRSIAACEGAVLVVDATQGVQAQTISNLYMAIEHDLEIIPVLNKCDMENAMPERVEDEIVDLLGCKREEILRCSAKTGEGVPEILDAIIERIPAPKGDPEAPLQWFQRHHRLFQSSQRYDAYRRPCAIREHRKRVRRGRDRNLEIGHESAQEYQCRQCGLYHFGYKDEYGSEGGRHYHTCLASVRQSD